MGKKTPQAPPPPDPYKVAGAQTGANVNSAIASGVLGNVNQSGPYGSTTFNQTDTYKMTGPDGTIYDVPRYTQTTTLSPEQQQLYNQQTQLGGKMNNLAIQQTDKLTGLLSQPISADGLPKVNDPSLAGLPDVTNDFTADRARVEDAMFQRLSPQMQRAREAEETRLVNQGFQRGTQGYSDALGDIGRQENDQRLAITERGLAEQQGLFGMSQANRARAFNEMSGLYGMQSNNRQNSLQEMLQMRNQPINEISALMSGGQVSLPGVNQYNAPQIQAANIGDYTYNSAGLAQQNYQTNLAAQTAKQNALIGALGGVAGAGLYGGASGKLGGLFKT